MAFIRVSLRCLYFSLGILAFCILSALGVLWTLWAVVGDEPATASRWISTFLGREVQIGDIDLSWRGLGPKLRLTEVRIVDPQTERQLLSFREAYLGAAPYRALVTGEWTPQHLTVVGGQLTVERKAEGCIRLHGLQNLQAPCPDPPRLPAWLLELTRLTLVDVAVDWIDPALERKPLGLQVGELQLRNKGNLHQIEGRATLPEAFGKEIAVKAKFTGKEIRGPESWGALHLKGEGLQLAPWQARGLLHGLHFTQGTGNLELGLRWSRAVLRQAVAKFEWKGLQIAGNARGAGVPEAVSFQHLAGTARYRRRAAGWLLEMPQLSVVRDDKPWPATALQVKMEREPVSRLQGQFAFLRLQDIAALFQLSDRLDPKLRLFLAEFQPVGELHDVKVNLPLRGKDTKDWKFSATAEQFGIQPGQHWPGCRGLSFDLHLVGGGGQLRINSRNAQLLGGHLEQPLRVDKLDGRVIWLRQETGWQARADNIQLQNQSLALGAELRLELLPKADIPHLDLSVIIEKLDLAALSQYLPARYMKPGLVRWLKQAFPKGGTAGGSLLFQGPANRFPPARGGGRFMAELDVRGAVLNYARGWPALERVDAHLHSDGRELSVHVNGGQIFNAQVTEATVHLADLDAAIVPLTVAGRARGDIEDVLRFIQRSPLQKKYGDFFEEIEFNGDTRLKLKLKMPLGKKKKRPEVDGELILANAYLRQQVNPFLEFTAIKGSLHLTQGGIKSEDLTAQLLAQPIQAELRSSANPQGETEVRLSFNGHLEAQRLTEKWFPALSSWFYGAADFTAHVIFQKPSTGGDKITTARISSALKGIAVTLPPPLAKPAEQAQRLWWEIRGANNKSKKQIAVTYGDRLRGLFEITTRERAVPRLTGEVRAGGGPPVLPEQGVRIVGTVPELSIAAWRKALAETVQEDANQPMQLNQIALQAHQMEFFGQHFSDVIVEANRVSSHWQIRAAGPSLRGNMTIPAEGSKEPLVVDLDYLHLSSMASGGEFRLTDPRLWPPLDLICRQCRYHNYELGMIKAHASPYANGLHLEELEIVSPLIKLMARGDWTVHGGTQWSHLDIKAHSPDLGQLLTEFDYQSNIAGGKTKVEIVAGWPGAPTSFALEQLDGSMRLTVGKGRLLDVEPGAGRLFGLLSVSTLPRRLALDFSDIFSKGFAFDRIQGTFSIRRGDAYSSKLVMEGPTAQVQASGRIGLATQDYDQIIAVTPNVFSSLPLAGAVAGGPVGLGVGTALMLADKLADKMFGAQAGQLLTYYYAVSGPWDKPVVTRVKKLFPSKKHE